MEASVVAVMLQRAWQQRYLQHGTHLPQLHVIAHGRCHVDTVLWLLRGASAANNPVTFSGRAQRQSAGGQPSTCGRGLAEQQRTRAIERHIHICAHASDQVFSCNSLPPHNCPYSAPAPGCCACARSRAVQSTPLAQS